MDEMRRRMLLSGAAALGRKMLPTSLTLPWVAATKSAMALDLPDRLERACHWFPLGVASGDPTPDSVIIWTRYAPNPLAPQGGMTADVQILWAVATRMTDGGFAQEDIVATGAVTAKPENGGAIHIDVTGLDPDTEYLYGFMAPDATISAVGKTKTAPSWSVSSARFGLVSCQEINTGRYGAFQRMVDEGLDFIIHCGDAIYENSLNGAAWPEELNNANLPFDLDGYRIRHAMYRLDPQLRAAYEAVPWIVSWDDHEFISNYWSSGGGGLSGSEFFERRAAAYQAYYEHMPIRPPAGLPDPQTGFRIHRRLVFGDLLDLMVLDTRQFRDQQGGNLNDPNKTMLGNAQKQWLKDSLSTSTAKWRSIVSQVPMMNVTVLGEPYGGASDKWQGYAAERAELLRYIANNGIQNVVVLTGDVHTALASNLKVNFNNALAPNVATEFGGMAITSGTSSDPLNEVAHLQTLLTLYSTNLHIRFLNALVQGYTVCDVTPQSWTTTYRTVDRSNPNAQPQTLARFRVNNGVAKINHLSGGSPNPLPALP